MTETDRLRVRRLARGQIIAAGGVPRPEQFRRAGLPPLVRASDLVVADDVADDVAAREVAAKVKRYHGPAF
jgi:hypothetical protein